MREMTVRQAETLEVIREYVRRHSYPPTNRELCELMGIRSSCTIHRRIDALRAKGHLTRANGRQRVTLPVEMAGPGPEGPAGGRVQP